MEGSEFESVMSVSKKEETLITFYLSVSRKCQFLISKIPKISMFTYRQDLSVKNIGNFQFVDESFGCSRTQQVKRKNTEVF